MPQRSSTRYSYEERVNAVLDFISRNPAHPLDLRELARVACLSPYHLHRVFTAMTGETPGVCIRRIRLQTAAYMLQFQPELPVTDIAHACGFSSSQNFARAFRSWSGVSPGQFRRCCGDNVVPPSLSRRQGRRDAPYLLEYRASQGIVTSRITRNPAVEAKGAAMNVVVTMMEERRVAYARQIGPYGKELGAAWERILGWAGGRGLLQRPGVEIVGVSWDNPELTPPERCRYDACVAVPEGVRTDEGIGVRTLPGGLHACYRRPTRMAEFGAAMNELLGIWLPESGYECRGVPFELYHGRPEEDGVPEEERIWDVTFCLPVKAFSK